MIDKTRLADFARFVYGGREPWMQRAACRGTAPKNGEEQPNPFFPNKGGSTRNAYEMCNSCPVKVECADYRERTGSVGIWGGKYTEHPTVIPDPVRFIHDSRPKPVTPEND